MELLRHVKQLNRGLPVILITAWSGLDGAVRAVKEGAFDYLAKPLKTDAFLATVRRALEDSQRDARQRKQIEAEPNPATERLRELMGPSKHVRRIVSDVSLVAPSDFSVIILGETGTGKELVARTIHESSPRGSAPLVAVDCGAIPETLFESELFGHEKGAFTGAVAKKPGKFDIAEGGTLFLDEIANLALGSQTKMLRAIQERSYFRVGATRPTSVNVRLIVATNENLNAAVRSGSFSRDLFYRLSEFTIRIPPLRERREDTVHIANQFLLDTNQDLGKNVRGFSDAAQQVLLSYGWPGNVRQLKAAVRRAVLRARDFIEPSDLALDDSEVLVATDEPEEPEFPWVEGMSLKEIVRLNTSEVERRAIAQALRRAGGNKAQAARLLKIDYTTLHAKIKQYRLKEDA
jgi:DNA-binding NtrC family response regulator